MKIVDLILQEMAPSHSQIEVAEALGYAGQPIEYYFTNVCKIRNRYLTFFDQIAAQPLAPERYRELLSAEVERLSRALLAECLRRHPDVLPRVRSITTVNSQGHIMPTPAERLVASVAGFAPEVELIHVNGTNCSSPFQGLRLALDHERHAPDSGYHLILGVELPSITLRPRPMERTDWISSDVIVSDGAFLLLLGPDAAPTARPMPRLRGLSSHFVAELASQLDSTFEGPLLVYRIDDEFLDAMQGLMRSAKQQLIEELEVDFERVDQIVVHPGSEQMLDVAAAGLEIDKQRLQRCYQTYADGGNRMSTLLWYTLGRYLEDGAFRPEAGPSLAIGLGPGVNVETLVVE
jgi:predicted naringenin-chalcone synthase